MKGVTLNTLDIKISGKDTNNDLAVFEQSGQTPNGGPPLHIHIDQDEWFFVTVSLKKSNLIKYHFRPKVKFRSPS